MNKKHVFFAFSCALISASVNAIDFKKLPATLFLGALLYSQGQPVEFHEEPKEQLPWAECPVEPTKCLPILNEKCAPDPCSCLKTLQGAEQIEEKLKNLKDSITPKNIVLGIGLTYVTFLAGVAFLMAPLI